MIKSLARGALVAILIAALLTNEESNIPELLIAL